MPLYAKIFKSKVEDKVMDLRKNASNITVDEFKNKINKIYDDLELLRMNFDKKYKIELDNFYNDDTKFIDKHINDSMSSIYEIIDSVNKLDNEK